MKETGFPERLTANGARLEDDDESLVAEVYEFDPDPLAAELARRWNTDAGRQAMREK